MNLFPASHTLAKPVAHLLCLAALLALAPVSLGAEPPLPAPQGDPPLPARKLLVVTAIKAEVRTGDELVAVLRQG